MMLMRCLSLLAAYAATYAASNSITGASAEAGVASKSRFAPQLAALGAKLEKLKNTMWAAGADLPGKSVSTLEAELDAKVVAGARASRQARPGSGFEYKVLGSNQDAHNKVAKALRDEHLKNGAAGEVRGVLKKGADKGVEKNEKGVEKNEDALSPVFG